MTLEQYVNSQLKNKEFKKELQQLYKEENESLEKSKENREPYKGILRGMREVAEATNNTDVIQFIDNALDNPITEDLEEPSQTIDDDTSNHGMLGLVNSLIISEYDAIDQYNSAMATAEAEGNIDIIPVLKDIIAEEHTHVGQLQAAAKLFDQSAGNVDKGKEEADTQLEQGEVEQTELDDITEE